MKPYEIRQRDDGKLELAPGGAPRALLVFDTPAELEAALSRLGPRALGSPSVGAARSISPLHPARRL
jgi:hypothetical protein